MSTLSYRRDIDGLRAVAVLPVVLFHAGYHSFSGGFVGVDVFFVISGYLITAILHREISNGSFSIRRFYERRFRRILPALSVVVLATLLAGQFFLFADEYRSLAESAIASVLFVPNIFFFQKTGYFAVDASQTPLLHTWSLGIEEQFYIVFPLLLALVWRLGGGRQLLTIIALLALVSFGLNMAFVERHPTGSFYLLPTRAWELLIGAALALLPAATLSHAARELLAVAGLALITLAIFTIDESMPFPGAAALLPTLGTAAVIYGNSAGNTLTARLLGTTPFVAVGLVSYSLYLWHWPVTVYGKMLDSGELASAAIVAVSLLLAAGSYYLVEQPFRNRVLVARDKHILPAAAAGMAALVVVALVIRTADGFPSRIPDTLRTLADGRSYLHADRACHYRPSTAISEGNACRFGREGGDPDFALLGDSHGDALRPTLEVLAQARNWQGLQLTRAGCRPLTGIHIPTTPHCDQYLPAAMDAILQSDTIEHVFLAGYWRVAYQGFGYRNPSFFLADRLAAGSDAPTANATVFSNGLTRTLDALTAAGKTVYILGDVPELGENYRLHYARALLLGISPPPAHLDIAPDTTEQALQDLARAYPAGQVIYVPIPDLLCPAQRCALVADGRPTYRDGDHISADTARKLGQHLTRWLDGTADPQPRSN